jgi:hypothetical protein
VIDDEPPKDEKLRLVADNDPARIIERQKQILAARAGDQVSESLAALIANLLRVLAGAGAPNRVPHELSETVKHYNDAYNAGNRGQMPGLENLVIDRVFREDAEHDKPQTEEEWRRWAADDPRRDYEDERHLLLHELRRHVLREIASTITGSDPQIRLEQGKISNLLRRLEEARECYFNGPRKPRSVYRQSIAEREIKNLRVRKRDEMIASLQQHQWIALYAVHSGDLRAFDAVDAFTFEVLAGKKLLERKPGRGRSKRDWKLTEIGTLAMSRAPSSILEVYSNS